MYPPHSRGYIIYALNELSLCFLLTQETETTLLRIDPSSKEVAYNPTFDQLFAPEVQTFARVDCR